MSNDPFDLAKLNLTPEQVAEFAPLQKKPKSKPQLPRSQRQAGKRFVQLPYERALATAGRLGHAPMAVLIEVAYLTFKAHGEPVPIANKALRAVGIDHEAKTRALHRLVMAGALRVIWRGRGRSPLAALRWD